ncbi:MAG: lasso peptide biosynthesis protein, partial [Deltaproteobacteria bacterium]|nr:lasso peptide biosynthesis protein [Deltaproteobacteria bacterium]
MLRSLLLFRRLRLVGLDVKIAFGVGDLEADLKGHAWLVYQGRYFLENEDPTVQYEAVFVYPR